MNTTKKILLSILMSISCATILTAQNIGINATGATPATSAMLDISSSDKGLLIPRVALTATNQASPVTSPATSLLVYNIVTAGTAPNNVVPGYYYWNGSAWAQLLSSSTFNSAWSVTGNAGLNPNNNFIGTTDATDLVIKTNNVEKIRVTSGGNVGIGINPPQAKLDVNGTYKLGTSGTVLTSMVKKTLTVNDNTDFDYNNTRQITVTLAGVTANATIILNPRSALPTGIGVAWCRASNANTIIIGFTNADTTERSIGNVTFDVTIIQ